VLRGQGCDVDRVAWHTLCRPHEFGKRVPSEGGLDEALRIGRRGCDHSGEVCAGVVVEQLTEELLCTVAGVIENHEVIETDRGGSVSADLDPDVVAGG
jgi:hypothetical protein